MNVRDAQKFLNINFADEAGKLYVLVVIVCMLGVSYCSYFRHSKQADFIELAKEIQAQCEGGGGCPAIPHGWQKTNCFDNSPVFSDDNKAERFCASYNRNSNSTSLGWHFYTTIKSQFFISNRYYSDSVLEARGGKNKPLVVMQYLKGKKEEVYRR